VFANAGLIHANYLHPVLTIGNTYPKGYVIVGKLEMFVPNWDWGDDLVQPDEITQLPGAEWTAFSLDGVLPVMGLTWDATRTVEVTPGSEDPYYSFHYAQWQFAGDTDALTSLHELQMMREKATETFYEDAYGTLPVHINFGAKLCRDYGNMLIACVYDVSDPVKQALLLEFLFNNKPYGCVILPGFTLPEPAPEVLHYDREVLTYDGETLYYFE